MHRGGSLDVVIGGDHSTVPPVTQYRTRGWRQSCGGGLGAAGRVQMELDVAEEAPGRR